MLIIDFAELAEALNELREGIEEEPLQEEAYDCIKDMMAEGMSRREAMAECKRLGRLACVVPVGRPSALCPCLIHSASTNLHACLSQAECPCSKTDEIPDGEERWARAGVSQCRSGGDAVLLASIRIPLARAPAAVPKLHCRCDPPPMRAEPLTATTVPPPVGPHDGESEVGAGAVT